MSNNKPDQGKVFSAEEVLRRDMSVAFDDEANQPFLAEMIKCMELYANHSQYKEITLPSQPVKEVSTPTVLTEEQLIAEAKKMYIPNSSLSIAETEAAIKAHINARKMSLQLTQQERRDIAENAFQAGSNYTHNLRRTDNPYLSKSEFLDFNYPL